MIPEVTHRIVALSGKITHRLVVKTSEIIGLEDFISSLLTKEREESDTYWKERVRETEQRYLLAFAGLDPAERHDEAVRVLRELDNLK